MLRVPKPPTPSGTVNGSAQRLAGVMKPDSNSPPSGVKHLPVASPLAPFGSKDRFGYTPVLRSIVNPVIAATDVDVLDRMNDSGKKELWSISVPGLICKKADATPPAGVTTMSKVSLSDCPVLSVTVMVTG